MPARRALVALAALSVSTTGVAAAQTPADPASSTTTSPSTTTTSAPPPVLPLPGPTTTTPPPPDPNAPPPDGEVGSEEPPPTDITVPPPAQPPAPPPNAPVFTAELRRQLKLARGALGKADRELDALVTRADQLNALLAADRARLVAEEAEHGAVIRRLRAARNRLRNRAVGAYTGNNLSVVNTVLGSGDVNELVRRAGMVDSLLRESRRAVQEYQAAKAAAGARITELVGAIGTVEAELASIQGAVQLAYLGVLDARVQVDALAAGSAIAIKGFTFPVAAPHRFSNDFGNPRMTGTEFEHTHQGTDIFAAEQSPLVACERGVVARMGTDRLGGIKLWLVGQSGTRYYYAHLAGYAPGVTDGMVVEAGTVLGFVGTTGNARGGAPHLHFEVHPQGGAAVNPYFLLRAADKAAATAPATPQPA